MGRYDRDTNTYTNFFGKTRSVGPEAAEQSQLRQEAFAKMEPELHRRLAEKGITDVVFQITGSTAVNASTFDSDIDVMVSKYRAGATEESVVMAVIRGVAANLKKELNIPFDISIFPKGQSMDNAVRFQAAVMGIKNRRQG